MKYSMKQTWTNPKLLYNNNPWGNITKSTLHLKQINRRIIITDSDSSSEIFRTLRSNKFILNKRLFSNSLKQSIKYCLNLLIWLSAKPLKYYNPSSYAAVEGYTIRTIDDVRKDRTIHAWLTSISLSVGSESIDAGRVWEARACILFKYFNISIFVN